VRVLNGSLEKHWRELVRLNADGAGIFVTINETNLKGRKTTDITRVRAQFCDLDGAPLDPVLRPDHPKPHIIVESSPGKWHPYWLVDDVEMEDFTGYQKRLAERFGGDPKVCDLPRVLRLPGFVHRKGEPFRSRIHSLSKMPPYKAADLFPESASKKQAMPAGDAASERFGDYGSDHDTPWGKLDTEALQKQKLDLLVPMIFPEATSRGKEGWRVTSAALKQFGRPDFEEDLSFHPLECDKPGITDFGYTGEDRQKRPITDPLGQKGGRTMLDIVQLYVLRVPIEQLAKIRRVQRALQNLSRQWRGWARSSGIHRKLSKSLRPRLRRSSMRKRRRGRCWHPRRCMDCPARS
jgi:hypothetical protein